MCPPACRYSRTKTALKKMRVDWPSHINVCGFSCAAKRRLLEAIVGQTVVDGLVPVFVSIRRFTALAWQCRVLLWHREARSQLVCPEDDGRVGRVVRPCEGHAATGKR